MRNKLLIVALISMLLNLSCVDDRKNNKVDAEIIKSKSTTTKSENLNISFLLDLSDRINPKKYPNPSMEFYLRDIAYIKSVSDAFITHLKQKKVRRMNDKIQLYFDPEPKNQDINTISHSLRYEITRKTATKDILKEIEQAYSTKPQKIYEAAIKDATYVGSDTWRFFKNKVNDFCILEDHRNILIILTDGYIYHENTQLKEGNLTSYLTPQLIRKYRLNDEKWNEKIMSKGYGFIPTNENLQKLEVLVLGINPDEKNQYEEDVIYKYWKDWFKTMQVNRYEIKMAVLPSNMNKIIKDFILN
ncbi:hypothetical protein [Kordia sp.]|uniref:hypothetical protein n=1 Tax=Kordia sp. TaxID=1965332 RepID=UPI003B597232